MKDYPLWEKLSSFKVSNDDNKLEFVERLAAENGWGFTFAQKIYVEYLKFIYLTSVSTELIVPSDEVNQVWRLHLTYTRSYWDELCGDLIGADVHNEPTNDDTKEEARYWHSYKRTLKQYRKEFRFSAPNDIWPAVENRFRKSSHMRVDTQSNLVLDKKKAYIFSAVFTTVAVLSVFAGTALP